MEEIKKKEDWILIVDDNKTIVASISGVLKKEGYRVSYAYDGFSAIKKAFTNKFDLILLDITLPDIDGFEVLRCLKENNSTINIPVIFISILDDDAIYNKGFEMGVMDYLKKPLPAAELIFRIKNYLRLRDTETQMRQSEMFFKSVVEDQTEFVIRYTPDGILTFVNTAFCKYLRMKAPEVIGRNVFDLLEIDPSDPIRESGTDISKEVSSDIIKIKRRGGKPIWHQWTHRVIHEKTTHQVVIQAIGRDISQTKEREEALLIWENIFRNAGWGIATILPNNPYFNQLNETYASMHGYKIEELRGKPIWTVFAKRSQNFVTHVIASLKKYGHYSYQSVHVKKNGEEFVGNTDLTLIRDENGNELLYVGSLTDISVLVNTTKALTESEEKFRNVFMNTPDEVLIIRQRDLAVVEANDRFFENSGLKKEDVLNKPRLLGRFFENLNEGKRLLDLLKKNNVLSNIETHLRTTDGHLYPALISFSKIKLNRQLHIVTIIRNIEEIKKFQKSIQQSETKFRLLADYNYNWEFWLGPDKKFIYVSPSCERISGYKAEEFMNNPDLMTDIIHPRDKARITPHFKHEQKDIGSEYSVEFMIIDRYGNEKWISHNCNPVFDNNGKFL